MLFLNFTILRLICNLLLVKIMAVAFYSKITDLLKIIFDKMLKLLNVAGLTF